MRLGLSALLALVLFACPVVHAQDTEEEPADEQAPASEKAPDPWLGCWSRTYDAAHLAKHPGQKVTALTLSIEKREPAGDKDPGKYLATITAKMRGTGDSYTNLDGARCSEANGKLSCVTDGLYVGQFSLEPAAKNMKIALKAGDHLALVPGVDLDAFTVLSADNPEHSLFLLQPAPTKTCGS
jgi:hypothetical protein